MVTREVTCMALRVCRRLMTMEHWPAPVLLRLEVDVCSSLAVDHGRRPTGFSLGRGIGLRKACGF